MEAKRFRSTIKWLDFFEEIIDVECPNCQSKAQLHRQPNTYKCCYGYTFKFQCNHCHSEIKEVEKYIYTVKRHCPYCAEVIDYRSMQTKKIKKEQEVCCKSCEARITYTPKVETVREFIWKGNNIEFTFWYSQTYQGNRFWAVNEEHLAYLEDFIRAKLRLRSKYRSGMMLVDKLPSFIKDKNNRDGLLKLISKLKEK
ncbi:hypothetical protein [Tenacibaculum sp. M341]|uniref:hypothetical protein n=1 Tax=Tenacibaculum sp. M341 TaxID=2530339 RepID=UPI0010503661|nr:hypothetical protein [Tenacibaculum sp. M341]TCI90734.1 hypothetical protein EYW44_13515 [Tenacibaculum sp. M341]